jgi:copper chaperone
MTTTYTLRVEGMHCASCGLLIDDTVEDLPGVLRAQTSLREGRTTVWVDPGQCGLDQILAAVAEAGYTARPESPSDQSDKSG